MDRVPPCFPLFSHTPHTTPNSSQHYCAAFFFPLLAPTLPIPQPPLLRPAPAFLAALRRAPEELDGVLLEAVDVVIAGLDGLEQAGVALAPVLGGGVAVGGDVDVAGEGEGGAGTGSGLVVLAPARVRHAVERRELALDAAELQLPPRQVLRVVGPDVLALHARLARPQHVARPRPARQVQ